jgi:hypothetical protein
MECSPAELFEEDVYVEAPLSIQQSNLQATKAMSPSAGSGNDKYHH